MKHLIISAVLFLAACAPGSMTQISAEEATIQSVTEVPGHSKDMIYDSSKMWIAETFESAKAVIEYESKETGTIIGNGIIPYPCTGFECVAKSGWKVPFTIKIEAKDDKFRTTFSNLQIMMPPTGAYGGPYTTGTTVPVRMKSDLDAIQPQLLLYNDQITAFLNNGKAKSDW